MTAKKVTKKVAKKAAKKVAKKPAKKVAKKAAKKVEAPAEETTAEDYTNSTSKGNYIRIGFNYNAYQNWLDMNNEWQSSLNHPLTEWLRVTNQWRRRRKIQQRIEKRST